MRNREHQVTQPSEASTPVVRRRSFPRISAIREERLRLGFTLSDVTSRAGLKLTRGSYVERDPTIARPGELEALRKAIDAIAAERGIVLDANTDVDMTAAALDLVSVVLDGGSE